MIIIILYLILIYSFSRENLVLRAALHPAHCSTIPNAVDATKFTPGNMSGLAFIKFSNNACPLMLRSNEEVPKRYNKHSYAQ